MNKYEEFAEWNGNQLHEQECQSGKAAKHILDADCDYDNGVFALYGLPCRLPRLFTVRFTAPVDYGLTDIITLKGREFKVMTRKMQPAPDRAFSAGAVVQCDVDLARNLVFFSLAELDTNVPGLIPVGTMLLLNHRRDELPFGWWFPGGEYYRLDTAVGRVLNNLPAGYKEDWGIVTRDEEIRLFDPALFFDGEYGRFPRPVNGAARKPGSVEGDAMRKIAGEMYPRPDVGMLRGDREEYAPVISGPFARGSTAYPYIVASALTQGYSLLFDSSLVVPTAEEIRPKNIGMTPAVYLGV